MTPAELRTSREPAPLSRLSALARLSPGEHDALFACLRESRFLRARKEIRATDQPVGPMLLLDGWAARARHFADGRRQLVQLLLPGDVFEPTDAAERSLVVTMALTDVSVAPAPIAEAGSALAAAYELDAAIQHSLLFRQIARLGRLDAYERVVDLLLEVRDRLALAGLVSPLGFALPVTQEILADTLGLTSVHVNRMLQTLRRDGSIEIRSNVVRLLEPARLEALVDWQPVHEAERR